MVVVVVVVVVGGGGGGVYVRVYYMYHTNCIMLYNITLYHIISSFSSACGPWLRTNGVNPNGAAAKVVKFDRLGKKVRPGTFGRIGVERLPGVPKRSLRQKA